MKAYIGTYTTGIYELQIRSGRNEVRLCASAENPSYLAFGPQNMLYAVLETEETGGVYGGAVSAFSIDADGNPVYRNTQTTGGRHPCHLCVSENRLYVANYSSGSLTTFPLTDGIPGPALQVLCHEGHGANPVRQEAPHAHCIVPVPNTNRLCAVDLGIDQLRFYRPCEDGLLFENAVTLEAGAGPRHIVFSGDGQLAWLVCELSCEVYVLKNTQGTWSIIEKHSTLPKQDSSTNICAAIRLSPDGTLLCATNRGHDSVACYQVDSVSGALSLRGIYPTGGKTPRDIAFSPDGSLLLAANQDSDTVTVLSVTDDFRQMDSIAVPRPVCILPL